MDMNRFTSYKLVGKYLALHVTADAESGYVQLLSPCALLQPHLFTLLSRGTGGRPTL